MTIRHELAAVAIFWFTVMSNISAAAEEENKAEAKRHFDVGTRLYEVEDYQGAVTEFETSVNLYSTKNGYFNLANCYKALHRYYEAQDAVEVLETRFGDKLDKTMRGKLDALKSLIESVTGVLTISSSPPNAKISLNGKPLSAHFIGRPIHLGPGEYRVDAVLNGYQSSTQNVTIQSQKQGTLRIFLTLLGGSLKIETDVDGATVTVDGIIRAKTPSAPISLDPGEHHVEISVNGIVQEARTVEINDGSTTTLSVDLGNRKVDASPSSASHPKHPVLFPLKIVGITATAVTAVLTGVFYGLAAFKASKAEEYSQTYTSPTTPDPDSQIAEANFWDAKSKTDQFQTAGLAMAISTGVFAAATVAVVVVEKKSKKNSAKKPESTSLSVQDGLFTVSF